MIHDIYMSTDGVLMVKTNKREFHVFLHTCYSVRQEDTQELYQELQDLFSFVRQGGTE